ncbi:MAG: phenylacetic acid degradation protein PaaN, partial [Rhodospirillales bacterium]|nr:phenylacetic acid degradation protein PaaN [Rhodospirillales bacterium]
MSHPLFDKNRAMLDGALAAIAKRDYWTPFPESPSPRVYGETANAEAKAAFEAQLNKPFELDQPGAGRVGAEASPYGFSLGIAYPKADPDQLIAAAKAATPAWRRTSIETRVGVSLEILQRINKRSFDIAYAVMHTTGQGFVMSFQAAGPHAQDRGLEAVALAYAEMTRTPAQARWEKPQGKGDPIRLDKKYIIVPRGIGLVIGCSTFPTWNGYPAIFADLATGNAVIVKPHPMAILPLAITVRIAREVLKEAGFDPNLVTLAADDPAAPVTQTLATRPDVALIDYTGSSVFGEWLEKNARQATLFAEKAGVNTVVIDSTADFKGMAQNLAFSLALYSGQMCTTPQNFYIPKAGIETEAGHVGFDDVAKAIAAAVDKLLGDPARGTEILGAIQSKATLARIEAAVADGTVVRASQPLAHPQFPKATIRTPLILKVDGGREDVYMKEMFGPIAYLIPTENTADSLAKAGKAAKTKGAITAAIYSTDPKVIDRATDISADAGVALSCNLTGGIFVNQSAAFSDFHASGCNPAANASL